MGRPFSAHPWHTHAPQYEYEYEYEYNTSKNYGHIRHRPSQGQLKKLTYRLTSLRGCCKSVLTDAAVTSSQ